MLCSSYLAIGYICSYMHKSNELIILIPQEISTHKIMEYSELQDVCTQQTSSSWAEDEKFLMHCQETQTDIESS